MLLCCFSAPVRAAAPGFDIIHIDLTLVPDFQAQTISGTERIHFRSLTHGLTELSFSANSLEVTASIDGAALVSSEIVEGRRIFRLPTPLRKGRVGTLTVTFRGKAPKGLAFDGESVSASYFTCDYMICDQDRTSDRATLDTRIMLAPGMDAVAPGKPESVSDLHDGHKLWHWRLTDGRSAYLFGFAAGRYQRVAIRGEVPALDVLTAIAPAEQVRTMFSDTERMAFFFGQRSGVPFPGKTYTQVLIRGSEAQEAASHSVIGLDEISPILSDPHEDWAIAHELAHQWWGNAITCADWSELWLNEGMTVFMVAAYKEARWGRADYDREIALANSRWKAAKDQGFDKPLSWQGTYPSLKLKRAMAYAKSVVFLDTLRRELGDDVFWRAIKRYTRDNFNKTVTAANLQRAFERESRRHLAPLLQEWVFGAP
jgi:aminopeptidase N